ncbi:MAG: glycosyltransferase family 2 protein [Cuniculiplasma sp.]
MNPENTVSVIITAHDRKKYLKDAINSILGQSLKNEFQVEIIVVKNFQDPDIDAFLSSNSIKTMFTDEKSFGVKLAIGMENASGSFICFMDDDDMFHPEKLSRIYSLFMSDPDLAYIHNGIYTISEDSKYSSLDGIDLHESRITIYDLSIKSVISKPGKITSSRADWYVSCISMRKEVAERYSPQIRKIERSLDKALFMASVDYGRKIGVLEIPLTYYRKHQSVTGIVGSVDQFLSSRVKFTDESIENLEKLSTLIKSANPNYAIFHQILIGKMLANNIIYSRGRKGSIGFSLKMLYLFFSKGCKECFYISVILLIHFLSPNSSIRMYMKIQNRGMN